jgi:phosphoglycolate phosphatase
MDGAKLNGVRALIFDLDGTLIDSKCDLIHSVNAMLEEVGRKKLAAETISGYIGHGAPLLVARALGSSAPEEERQHALQFFLAHYEEHKLDTTRAYPGVAETLAQLHRQGLPLAVLTNKPVRISVHILDQLGLTKYFRVIYGGNSFKTKKPDPLGARTILEEFGTPPRQAVVIGDSEVDVQTARNAKTFAAAVNYGFGVHNRKVYPADVYLDGIAEVVPLLTGEKKSP